MAAGTGTVPSDMPSEVLRPKRPERLARWILPPDPGHELVGKTGEASHRCQSRIPRACKFMAHCRDLPNCSFCHHEVHQSRETDRPQRPERRARHVCSSLIPRACRFMQHCRDADSCQYCHDESHG
ncbi:unnamed protein product [Effrenium voratum]|nr:unnamed protein product [Effrenium voratum]